MNKNKFIKYVSLFGCVGLLIPITNICLCIIYGSGESWGWLWEFGIYFSTTFLTIGFITFTYLMVKMEKQYKDRKDMK